MGSEHTNRGFKRARETRDALGLAPDGPLPDVLEAVEDLGGAHVVLLDLGDGVAGALVRPDCPLLFVNGAQAPQRQRFTLAHEFGHHRLEHASVVDRPQAFTDYRHDPHEVEANAFAAEFLIPREALHRWADTRRPGVITLEDVVRLAAAYGVSAQMVRYRLATVGILTDQSRADKLDREIAANDHLMIAAYLDLTAPRDRLAASAGRLPRIPAPLRAGPLGRLLAGEIDGEGLAQQLSLDPAAVRRMLVNFGLDMLAAAA